MYSQFIFAYKINFFLIVCISPIYMTFFIEKFTKLVHFTFNLSDSIMLSLFSSNNWRIEAGSISRYVFGCIIIILKPKKAFLVPVNLTISFNEGQIETKDNTSCSVYVLLFFGTSIADGRILGSLQAEAFFFISWFIDLFQNTYTRESN